MQSSCTKRLVAGVFANFSSLATQPTCSLHKNTYFETIFFFDKYLNVEKSFTFFTYEVDLVKFFLQTINRELD